MDESEASVCGAEGYRWGDHISWRTAIPVDGPCHDAEDCSDCTDEGWPHPDLKLMGFDPDDYWEVEDYVDEEADDVLGCGSGAGGKCIFQIFVLRNHCTEHETDCLSSIHGLKSKLFIVSYTHVKVLGTYENDVTHELEEERKPHPTKTERDTSHHSLLLSAVFSMYARVRTYPRCFSAPARPQRIATRLERHDPIKTAPHASPGVRPTAI